MPGAPALSHVTRNLTSQNVVDTFSPMEAGPNPKPSPWTWAALGWVLIVFPLLLGNGGGLIPGLAELTQAGDRGGWFNFWATAALLEWIGFFLCLAAVRSGNSSLSQIGFTSKRPRLTYWLFALTVALFLGVILARHYGYYAPPSASEGVVRGGRALFTTITTGERFFWIGMSLTAAFCEETMYRGFALTRLRRLLGSSWLAILVATFAFAYFHGGFGQGAVLFGVRFGLGLAFAGIYLWRKSLWPAIFLHFLIDASLVLAPT